VKQTLDLSPLAPDYEIVGELDDAAESRTYIATRRGDANKRRDDQTAVLITIVGTPEGDEANALSHLAADTKLLMYTPHRRLVPVLDGRWLGDDAFAVVTQRLTDPSLAQRLVTGETFTNPRIAAILREVNGLLEWARDQKIVHRGVSASRVYLEPKTDRVRVAFTIAPIRRLHRSDAQDDARTIARLAVAMLTGYEDPRSYEGQTLAQLRPDLPARLGEATTALLDEKNTGATPDVAAYLALIGMADPVAAGEAERERIRAEILEEQRAEREKLAGERAAFEQTMADERASFERTMADQRASFERMMAAEREQLERERAELQRAVTAERETLQRAASAEREQLVASRAALERAVAEQRAELERAAARDRRQIDALREELRRAGEREVERKRQTALEDITDTEDVLDREELATPAFITPALAPLDPLNFDDGTPLMSDEDIVFEPARVEVPTSEEPGVVEEPVATRSTSDRRKWILSGSAVAVLVVIGIGASVIGSRQPAAGPARPGTRTVVSPAVIAPASQAPASQAPASQAPVATPAATPAATLPLALDSASVRTAARWLDSLKEAHPVELPRLTRASEPAPERQTERPADRTTERATDRATPATRPATTTSTPRPRPSMVDDPFFIPGSSTPSRPDTTPTTPTPPR
jgi:hypothetical protein